MTDENMEKLITELLKADSITTWDEAYTKIASEVIEAENEAVSIAESLLYDLKSLISGKSQSVYSRTEVTAFIRNHSMEAIRHFAKAIVLCDEALKALESKEVK